MLQADQHELFRRLLDGVERVVITTHINPDGDALGSQIGLARYLRSTGRLVRLVNQDPTPENLRFLEDDDLAAETYGPEQHDALLREIDLAILVDNSAPDRLGRMEEPLLAVAEKTLCVDHHPTRGTPWGHDILDRQACATAEIVYELATRAGWQPDERAAEALYVGIATDTGFFRFNSTNVRAHLISAELLDLGVHPAGCYQRIYERNSEAYTRLLGHALTRLQLDAGGAVASLRLTRELVEQCRAETVDTSEMTTALLAMDLVRIAALFRELGDGRIKVSLRSKGSVDVHRLATGFGGGGHRNASGIVMDGDLDDVAARVLERAVATVAAPSEG